MSRNRAHITWRVGTTLGFFSVTSTELIYLAVTQPPANFVVLVNTQDAGITLNFTASTGAVMYIVNATGSSGDFTSLTQASPPFSFPDVVLGTTYAFEAIAENANGLRSAVSPLNVAAGTFAGNPLVFRLASVFILDMLLTVKIVR